MTYFANHSEQNTELFSFPVSTSLGKIKLSQSLNRQFEKDK